MDASVHNPPCFALFDPLAPECAHCEIQDDCMNEQEKRLLSCYKDCSQPSVPSRESANPTPSPPRKENPTQVPKPLSGDEQYIPEHTRRPLEIPPVGSTIQTTYRGQTYQAVIVDDPANPRLGGRSILFDGAVYRTLTAAAHAISPGIHSGSVWRQVGANYAETEVYHE